jgi:L-lysine 2,3-aminomutase
MPSTRQNVTDPLPLTVPSIHEDSLKNRVRPYYLYYLQSAEERRTAKRASGAFVLTQQ